MYGLVASRVANAAPHGNVVVRQNENAWLASNAAKGTSSYVLDATAPYGYGALQMSTPSGNNNSKSTRTRTLSPNVKLSDITTLNYWTKQVTASNPAQTTSLQLTVNGLTGTNRSTTLVFEPYWNVAGHAGTSQNLPNGVWQQWNVRDGVFWSTKTYTTAGLVYGAGGSPFYTLAQVIANNPNAKVTSIVVNIGTSNPGNVSLVDGVNFNGIVYDFEPTIVAPVAPVITAPIKNKAITATNGSVDIVWNSVPNATRYLVSIDSGSAESVDGTSLTKILTAGKHTVTVQSVAVSGLVGGISAVRNFTVVIPDTLSPTEVIAKSDIDGKSVKSPNYDITLSAKDDVGLERFDVTLWRKDDNRSDAKTILGSWGNPIGELEKTNASRTINILDNILYTANKSLPDGEYIIYFTATDLTKKATNGNSIVFTIDNTTPEVPTADFTATPSGAKVTTDGYTKEKNFKFDLKSSNDVVRYQLKYRNEIENAKISNWNPTDLNGYQGGLGVNTYIDNFTQGEGKHYFSFSACDSAGNCSAFSEPFVVIYDETPPTIKITTSSATGVSGTVTDNLSGVKSVEVSLDGGNTWEENGAEVDGGTWSFEFPSELTVGVHDIAVRATDNADNFNRADTNPEWATERIEVEKKDIEKEPSTPSVEPAPPTISPTSSTPPTPTTPVTPTPTPTPFTPANANLTPATSSNVLADEDSVADNTGDRLAQARSNDSDVLDADDSRTGADGQSDSKSGWSLANLIMTIVAGIIGLVALLGLGKKEGRVGRVLTVIISAGAIATFFVKEDMTQSMGLVNLWTIAFVAVPIAQAALLGKITKSDTKK